MKKTTKIILCVGIALCAAGIILYGVGRATGGMEEVKNSKKEESGNVSNEKRAVLEKEALGDMQGIEGSIADVDLVIKPSGDDSCYLSYDVQTRKGENPVTYSVEDGVLKLEESGGYDSSYYVQVDISFLDKMTGEQDKEEYTNLITLYLPEDKILEDCKLSMGDGDMMIRGLRCKNLDLALRSGDLIGKELEAETGVIAANDGDVELRDITCWNLNLRSESGDVELTSAEFKDAAITLEDGDLEAEELILTGEVQIQSESGDVKVAPGREKSGRLKIEAKTSSGDITAASFWKGSLHDDDYDDTASYERDVEQASGILTIQSEDGDISIE